MNNQRGVLHPPRAKQIGLGVDSEYSQKTGLYGCLSHLTEHRICYLKDTKRFGYLDNLCLLLTFPSSILNRLLIEGGWIKSVNVRANNVPMVAASSRL